LYFIYFRIDNWEIQEASHGNLNKVIRYLNNGTDIYSAIDSVSQFVFVFHLLLNQQLRKAASHGNFNKVIKRLNNGDDIYGAVDSLSQFVNCISSTFKSTTEKSS
jgi:sRNA-binding regulator protein Hfq